jgi:hypothetical protein
LAGPSAGIVVCAAVFTALAGCSRDLKINPEGYRGPRLSRAADGGKHLVVAELPSPGWAVELDATRQRADGTDVFVTLRRPNPAGVYTQQVVTQRMITRVDASEPLGILARVVEYAEESDKAYRLADR